MELEGRKELVDTVKPHSECTHRFPSFGRFECVLGLFWPQKWLFLALNCSF